LDLRDVFADLIAHPDAYRHDPYFAELAEELLSTDAMPLAPAEPIRYRTWGEQGIDDASHQQMRNACQLPAAVGGALMPDAHVGYGLPIGGVLALANAVVPYGVGVDIACRMKLSVLDVPAAWLDDPAKQSVLDRALEQGTRFGVGSEYRQPQAHAVMDADWSVAAVTSQLKDKAWRQLGTSGSGNHFVEFGLLTLREPAHDLPLEPGSYVALLSHSGSRGTGAAVCNTYSTIAKQQLPRRYKQFADLAWLELSSQAGAEYWAAMNLMGEYAAANHDVIHHRVAELLSAQIMAGVENHHNFAWKEIHQGQEVIVHRKGATPAGLGVLGVIPGSMADPAYVVRGKGNAASLASASHGAGRAMSRTKAKQIFSWPEVRKQLTARGVRVLSAGADEVPGVYKPIDEVMRAQHDLVDVVARFDPRVVKMCGDGSQAED
jgi:tRNA-splicing ligase RtcB